jgi:predicted porin
MKKTLCALAVGATICIPTMSAAADVKIYGRAHVSLDYLDDGKDYNEVGLSSNASRLGFKAEQKLENGMTVFGQIEQQINFSSGSSDSNSVDFSTRNTFVGLKSKFGQLKIGRFDSAFKVARGPVNFFGDQVGDLRNATRSGNLRFDERNDNTIEYKTPQFADGFQLTAALSLHEGTTAGYSSNVSKETSQTITVLDTDGVEHLIELPTGSEIHAKKGDSKNNKAYDLALTYNKNAIDFAAAYEHYEEDTNRGKRDAFRVAAAYNMHPAFNLGAFYQYATHDNSTANPNVQVFGVAADYKITPETTVRGHIFQRDVDAVELDATLIALGIEHRLDKTARIYANLATALNDEKSRITPWEQARSNNVAGTAGKDTIGLSMGMRYDF